MTYEQLEVGERHHEGRAGDSRYVFRCCGLVMCLAPQAWFHLWHEHAVSPAHAWAMVEALAGPAPAHTVSDELDSGCTVPPGE